MKKITLTVNGMSCSHCEKRVCTALTELNGVKKVSASAKKSQVICQFDETLTSQETIAEAIVEAGYEVIV